MVLRSPPSPAAAPDPQPVPDPLSPKKKPRAGFHYYAALLASALLSLSLLVSAQWLRSPDAGRSFAQTSPPPPPPAVPEGAWQLYLVKDPGAALCLDGSAPGYYIRTARGGAHVRKWIVHLQGGGWCRTPEDCLRRAQGHNPWGGPSLGGSGAWPRTAICPDQLAPPCVGDGGDHGILSPDPAVNPGWADAHAVFVAYCDGGSFAGAREAPLAVNGSAVFLRGRAILDAVVADLLPRIAGATDVLLKGESAGGQALLVHASRLARALRAAGIPRVSAAVFSGLFLDVAALGGTNTMRPFTESWVTLHNATGALPAACTTRPPRGLSPPLCGLSQQLLAHVDPELPLFISQFAADSAQLSWVMGLRCGAGFSMSMPPAVSAGSAGMNACNARKVEYLNGFRVVMHRAVDAALDVDRRRRGAWVAGCPQHIIGNSDGAWAGILVQGQTQRDAFCAWYHAAHGGGTGSGGNFMTGSGPTGSGCFDLPGGATGTGTGSPTSQVRGVARAVALDGKWGTNPSCELYASPAVRRTS